MVRQEIRDLVSYHLPGKEQDDWDIPVLLEELRLIFPLPPDLDTEGKISRFRQPEIEEKLLDHAQRTYEDRKEAMGPDTMRTMERLLMLRSIDDPLGRPPDSYGQPPAGDRAPCFRTKRTLGGV